MIGHYLFEHKIKCYQKLNVKTYFTQVDLNNTY